MPSGVGGLLPGATHAERRASVAVLSNVMDDFGQLLFVQGTARGVEADRTLTLNFREVVADAFTDQLAPLVPDSEVTDAELAGHDLFVLGGAEDNGLVARLAAEKKLPVELAESPAPEVKPLSSAAGSN